MSRNNAGSDEAPFVDDLRAAVRAYIRKRGMKQMDFCAEAGFNCMHLSQFLNHHVTGTAIYHHRLAEAIGLSIRLGYAPPPVQHCASCDGHSCPDIG